MNLSLTHVIGLAACAFCINAQQVEMGQTIPNETQVKTLALANGVKTFVQENMLNPRYGSMRVVLRREPFDDVLYVYDGRVDDLNQVEEFFAYCKEQTQKELAETPEQPLQSRFYSSSLPSLRSSNVNEIAVVAVGDFPAEQVGTMIENHFASIEMGTARSGEEGVGPISVTRDAAMREVGLRISIPNPKIAIRTYADLQEGWKSLLLQDILQNRLERCSRFQEEGWIHPHPRFFYPVAGYAVASEEVSKNLLSFMLWQIESIRNDGFSEEEFLVSKRNAQKNLQYLSSCAHNPDSRFLASYYVDQFLMGSDQCFDYGAFLNASETVVKSLCADDLDPYIDEFLDVGKRAIQVVYPEHARENELLTAEKIQKMSDRIFSLAAFFDDSYISDDPWMSFEEDEENLEVNRSYCRKKKKGKQRESSSLELINNVEAPEFRFADNIAMPSIITVSAEPFFQLPISDKEKRLIKTIISTMADKNVFQLAFEKRSLEKKGKEVNNVHPLRFIGHIFSHPELKSNMRSIRKSSFKWDGFMDGFGKRMKLESSNNNLLQYVDGFCLHVGADKEHVLHYIHKRDWEGLVKYLL